MLSNGISSPVFTAPNTNDQDMKSVNIQDYSLVKRVNGTTQGSNLCYLIFSKRDGTEIAKLKTSEERHYSTEFVLDDAEEIIGIFGKTDSDKVDSLGFIVWKPPRI